MEHYVTLEVFLKVSGLRSDKTAGFRSWATSRKVTKQTFAQWQALFEQYLQRPVN